MAALTGPRQTPELSDDGRVIQLPVEANTTIHMGGLVALDANNYAVPAQLYGGAPLNVLRVIGVAQHVYAAGVIPPGLDAINVASSAALFPQISNLGAAGAISVGVRRRGVYGFDYDGTVTSPAGVDLLCFANDDHTVSLADGSGGTTIPNTTSITFPAAAPLVVVLNEYIQPGSVTVTSASGGGGTVYVEGTDYAIDYQAGLIMALAGGGIAASSTKYITYKYGKATKPVVGMIVAVDATYAWVDVLHDFMPALNAAGLQN